MRRWYNTKQSMIDIMNMISGVITCGRGRALIVLGKLENQAPLT